MSQITSILGTDSFHRLDNSDKVVEGLEPKVDKLLRDNGFESADDMDHKMKERLDPEALLKWEEFKKTLKVNTTSPHYHTLTSTQSKPRHRDRKLHLHHHRPRHHRNGRHLRHPRRLWRDHRSHGRLSARRSRPRLLDPGFSRRRTRFGRRVGRARREFTLFLLPSKIRRVVVIHPKVRRGRKNNTVQKLRDAIDQLAFARVEARQGLEQMRSYFAFVTQFGLFSP